MFMCRRMLTIFEDFMRGAVYLMQIPKESLIASGLYIMVCLIYLVRLVKDLIKNYSSLYASFNNCSDN
jgi:hypothetical protein